MIVTFSGTGNSFLVAQLLQRRLGGDMVKLQYDILKNGLNSNMIASEHTIIWVFPTYSWGIPPVLLKFIDKTNPIFHDDALHHLVVTCGDDTGDLSRQWERLLDMRGWKRGGMWSVQMPNTYVLMKGFNTDPAAVEKRKLDLCERRVADIALEIKKGTLADDVVRGSWKWIKTKIIYPWFVMHEMSPEPFHASDHCISCGLCEEQCPTCNISMIPVNDPAARPQWGDDCAFCLRCYHHCPAHAIEYGRKTRGKGQYKILKFINDQGLFK